MPAPDESSLDHASRRRVALPAVAAAAIMLIACWAVIFSGDMNGRGASDDLNYHWPAIERFAEQFPSPDLSDYASATTPGYHLVLSPFVRAGLGHTGSQLIASLWTLAFIGVLSLVVARRFGWLAMVLMLPTMVSMYVLYPGVWLLPDNAGWLGVLVILLLCLRVHPSWRTHALCGAVLAALVCVRQIHIWVAAPVWVSAWIGNTPQTPAFKGFLSEFGGRAKRVFVAFLWTLPAFGMLLWFVLMWGGLVPPTFQNDHQGANVATPGFILMQSAILSVFFVPAVLSGLGRAWRAHKGWIFAAALIGMFAGVAPASSYNIDAGRYSGWWNIIAKLPTFADRSPVFALGSVVGALAIVGWGAMLDRRDAWVLGGALGAFVAAQSANFESWQRYHEPMLLVLMLLVMARGRWAHKAHKGLLVGSLILAGVLGSLTASKLIGHTRTPQIESTLHRELDSSEILENHPIPQP